MRVRGRTRWRPRRDPHPVAFVYSQMLPRLSFLLLGALPLSGCFTAPSPVDNPRPVTEMGYLRSRAMMVPVDGVRPTDLSDTFTARRRGGRTHNALDVMARRGTPVVAADAGVVRRISTNALGGNTVYVVDPSRRFVHYYAHLDRYAAGLREGMELRKGDPIGTVGTTGNASASAPHLHYQLLRYKEARMWWTGDPVNPLPYLTTRGNTR